MAEPRRTGAPVRRNGLHRWHRGAGVAAAVFLVFLLLTGVPLQFSAALNLGGRHVGTAWLLDWYGMEAPAEVWVSGPAVNVGDTLFLDGRAAATLAGFRGAVTVNGVVAAAGAREIVLLETGSGTEIDRFHFAAGVERIGRQGDTLVVATGSGIEVADAALVNFSPGAAAPEVAWADPTAAAAPLAARHRAQFRQRMLSVERLLQDLHSGRVLGATGVLLIDLASAVLAFMAVSGLIMWWRAYGR